ncbi:MAG: hypothetical protein NC124_05075 [Clostridium sp.]|nr:hypothetical protein [Clostridium sp.]
MPKKEIDFAALQKAVAGMEKGLNEANPNYKEFVSSITNTVSECNSDFIVSLEKVLRAFADNKTKKALEAVTYYKDDIEKVYGAMMEADRAISEKIKEGK